MILAAGRGTRLGALGQARAKVLMDVAGRPLLLRHLDLLVNEGFERVVVNVSHLANQITTAVQGYEGPIEVICVEEAELLGTAGGVRNALALLQPGPFLVLYGDVLVRDSLRPMIELHGKHKGVATLAVHRADCADGKGTVEVDAEGRITRFIEKGATTARHPFLINSGIYVIEAALVSSLPPGRFCDFGMDVFPQALRQDRLMLAHVLRWPVIDLGTREGLAQGRAAAEGDWSIG
jgi:mannose-1-phosphate guanylyltransferase